MSINPYFYVGPFIKCTTSVKLSVFSKKQCNDHQGQVNGNFCNICGKKLQIINKEVEEPLVNAWEVIEDIGEVLCIVDSECCSDLIHYFAPNELRLGAPNRKMTLHCSGLYGEDYGIIDNINSEVEKNWFRKAFEKEIDYVKNIYDKVEICWGIVSGYS